MELEPARRRAFQRAFVALLQRFGAAPGESLELAVTRAIAQTEAALSESASDGASLSPLEVVRIRVHKFAAAQLSPALYREPARLVALRREILQLARALLGEDN